MTLADGWEDRCSRDQHGGEGVPAHTTDSSLKQAAGKCGRCRHVVGGDAGTRMRTVIVLEIDGPPKVIETPKTGG
jgi:hypothetical protein